MGLSGVIRVKEGIAYFTHTDAMWSEPVHVTNWWRIGNAHDYVLEDGQSAYWDTHRNSYCVQSGYTKREIQASKEVADFTTEAPVNPPTTRLPVRWNDGRWQRQTSKGWK